MRPSVSNLAREMLLWEAGSPQRSQHLLKVWTFAALIAEGEQLSPDLRHLVESAAVVHDIGIRPSLQKGGTGSGPEQESEGPPAARILLEKHGYPTEETDRICFLVGHHHTLSGVDGIDYRILLEADYLVNAFESCFPPESIKQFGENVFRTPTGRRLLQDMFGVSLSVSCG